MTDHLRQTLPRSVRIRSRRDFERVFRLRIRASDSRITLYAAPSEQAAARLGIAAGHRLGSAVVRNRIKRLVREAFRRVRHALPPGTDWIVVPKAGTERTIQEDLQVAITTLARKLIGQVNSCRAVLSRPHTSANSGERGTSAEPRNQGAARRNAAQDNARKKKAPGA